MNVFCVNIYLSRVRHYFLV